MKILLVEDDVEMAKTLKDALSSDYVVELAFFGKDGEYLVHINDYDLIILDILLPDLDGITVCKKIRANGVKTPVLMLTGESEIEKKVVSLDAGADDYLLKPFHLEELRARIRALLRRQPEMLTSNILKIGDLQLDLVKKTVTRNEKRIVLKRKELQILEYFMRNPGKLISRSMFLEHVWDSAYESFGNTIDVHITYLRNQLDKPFDKKLIKTVYGLGYKMEA